MPPQRLLRLEDVAMILAVPKKTARKILQDHGIHPIFFGRGRGRGNRWPESMISALIDTLYAEAAPKAKSKPQKQNFLHVSIADMTAADLFALTQRHPLQ